MGYFYPAIHFICLWFCFADLIQQDLDFVKIHWNTHYNHQSRHDTVPGKPDELYFLPENFGVLDLLQPVSPGKLDEARMKCKTTDSKNAYHFYFWWRDSSLSQPCCEILEQGVDRGSYRGFLVMLDLTDFIFHEMWNYVGSYSSWSVTWRLCDSEEIELLSDIWEIKPPPEWFMLFWDASPPNG